MSTNKALLDLLPDHIKDTIQAKVDAVYEVINGDDESAPPPTFSRITK